MFKYQILRAVGAGLLMAGLLIFLNATSNQHILNHQTIFGIEAMGQNLHQDYLDQFNRQQWLGGTLATLGASFRYITSATFSLPGKKKS